MTEEERARRKRVADLVDAYYRIQKTRKGIELREKAMSRDEVELIPAKAETVEEGDWDEEDLETGGGREKDKNKKQGKILAETSASVRIMTTGQKPKEIEIPRSRIKAIRYRRFETWEDAKKAIFCFPVGRDREANVSSDTFLAMEEDIKHEFKGILKDWRVWTDWLVEVKGIGEVLACGLWAHIDPMVSDKPSSVWKFAGHHVQGVEEIESGDRRRGQGHAPRLQKGRKRDWNRALQTILWNAGQSLVLARGTYRDLYQEIKADEVAHAEMMYPADPVMLSGSILAQALPGTRKGFNIRNLASAKAMLKRAAKAGEEPELVRVKLTRGHLDARARRRMRKIFIAHFLQYWRMTLGLKTRPVYIVSKDGVHEEIPILRG